MGHRRSYYSCIGEDSKQCYPHMTRANQLHNNFLKQQWKQLCSLSLDCNPLTALNTPSKYTCLPSGKGNCLRLSNKNQNCECNFGVGKDVRRGAESTATKKIDELLPTVSLLNSYETEQIPNAAWKNLDQALPCEQPWITVSYSNVSRSHGNGEPELLNVPNSTDSVLIEPSSSLSPDSRSSKKNGKYASISSNNFQQQLLSSSNDSLKSPSSLLSSKYMGSSSLAVSSSPSYSLELSSSMGLSSNDTMDLDVSKTFSRKKQAISTAEISPEEMITLEIPQPQSSAAATFSQKGSSGLASPIETPRLSLLGASKISATPSRTSTSPPKSPAKRTNLSRSQSKVSYEHSDDYLRDPRVPRSLKLVDDSCPCDRHHRKMKSFVNWFLNQEDLKDHRRAVRPTAHRPIPEFREAFPLDVNDWNPVDAKRGKRVRRVYSECTGNWIPYTERHPSTPSLRKAVSDLQRSIESEAISRSLEYTTTSVDLSEPEQPPSAGSSINDSEKDSMRVTTSLRSEQSERTASAEIRTAKIAPESMIPRSDSVTSKLDPSFRTSPLYNSIHGQVIRELGKQPGGTILWSCPILGSLEPSLNLPVRPGWQMEVDLATETNKLPPLRQGGRQPAAVYSVTGWGVLPEHPRHPEQLPAQEPTTLQSTPPQYLPSQGSQIQSLPVGQESVPLMRTILWNQPSASYQSPFLASQAYPPLASANFSTPVGGYGPYQPFSHPSQYPFGASAGGYAASSFPPTSMYPQRFPILGMSSPFQMNATVGQKPKEAPKTTLLSKSESESDTKRKRKEDERETRKQTKTPLKKKKMASEEESEDVEDKFLKVPAKEPAKRRLSSQRKQVESEPKNEESDKEARKRAEARERKRREEKAQLEKERVHRERLQKLKAEKEKAEKEKAEKEKAEKREAEENAGKEAEKQKKKEKRSQSSHIQGTSEEAQSRLRDKRTVQESSELSTIKGISRQPVHDVQEKTPALSPLSPPSWVAASMVPMPLSPLVVTPLSQEQQKSAFLVTTPGVVTVTTSPPLLPQESLVTVTKAASGNSQSVLLWPSPSSPMVSTETALPSTPTAPMLMPLTCGDVFIRNRPKQTPRSRLIARYRR